MTEVSTHELIAERMRRVIARGRRATVRSAVNTLARKRSVAPRQVVSRETGLPTLWLLRATKCDAAPVALCIKMISGSGIGQELSIPGNIIRRWTRTTDRAIAALERLRTNGLVSWKQVGDGFVLVPHLH